MSNNEDKELFDCGMSRETIRFGEFYAEFWENGTIDVMWGEQFLGEGNSENIENLIKLVEELKWRIKK